MDEQGNEQVEELDLHPAAVVRNRRPGALWAVLAAVGLAAGALVITSADDDGNPRPGLPVDLAGASAGRGGAEAAADAMYAWVTYVAGPDLPALGGEGTAYRLTGDVDEARVRAIAGALGLEGEVRSDGPGVWSVTGAGGLGRLDVYSGGGAWWSYFAGYQDCVEADGSVGGCAVDDCVDSSDGAVRCSGSGGASSPGKPLCGPGTDCVLPTTSTTYVPACETPDVATDAGEVGCAEAPADTDCRSTDDPSCPDDTAAVPPCPDGVAPGEECAEIEPSPDLPSEDDARRVALELLERIGVDVDDARVLASAGFDAWYIDVEPLLDGVPSGLHAAVEVGPDLQVVSGSGVLGEAESLGDYPLLDTRAAIERANEQQGAGFAGEQPAIADDTPTAVEGTTGGTDTGGSTDGSRGGDIATDTTIPGTDPCAVPEGASDGCGGTTGCGGDGCTVEPQPCQPQADGREICEVDCAAAGSDVTVGTSGSTDVGGTDGGGPVTTIPCTVPTCPQAVGSEDIAVGAPESIDCTPPPDPGVEPEPVPEPTPVEIVLVDAEPSLVLLPANDGSDDAYLVPAYRFRAEDGGQVDLPAVADDALAGPDTTDATDPPDTPVPPAVDPRPCEVLEEGDDTGTTHTIQPAPDCVAPDPSEDPVILGEGVEPAIGVAYYVDIDTQCAGGSFVLGSNLWVAEDDAVAGWADPGERHEGGTFTLDAPDHGRFVGDSAGTKVADFTAPNPDLGCTPEPRG